MPGAALPFVSVYDHIQNIYVDPIRTETMYAVGRQSGPYEGYFQQTLIWGSYISSSGFGQEK